MAEKNKLFTSKGYEIEIIKEFEYRGDKYCVYNICGGYDLSIGYMSNFIKEEQTQKYILNKEIERLQNEKDAEIKKIQDEAIKSLESRIRINVAFGSSAGMSAIGIQIAEQLKKLIEEKKK